MSFVYAWAPDKVYQNGSVAAYARSIGVTTARYPAGQASYWDWENPIGKMGFSSLDPHWDGIVDPEEDWMSLQEYLSFCHAAGITKPLIGVNYNCGGEFWLSQSESIEKAKRQVQYVVSKGFRGAFYYIGNEDEAYKYPAEIKAHALAMKEIDPTIKTMYNQNGIGPTGLKKFMRIAGTAIDGVEFHGKWPVGGKPNLPPRSYEQWLEEVPLMDHKNRGGKMTWRARLAELRSMAGTIGRPDLMLANNEYGIGKDEYAVGFNKYTKSLLAVEFAMEMYIGGFDMAAFWDNHDRGAPVDRDRMLTDTQADYRFNPMHIGFALLGRCVGSGMMSVSTSLKRVHGFAAFSASKDYLRIALINKYEDDQEAKISLPADFSKDFTQAYAESMVDTDDHWGTTLQHAVEYSDWASCKLRLPKLSFTLITFEVLR